MVCTESLLQKSKLNKMPEGRQFKLEQDEELRIEVDCGKDEKVSFEKYKWNNFTLEGVFHQGIR